MTTRGDGFDRTPCITTCASTDADRLQGRTVGRNPEIVAKNPKNENWIRGIFTFGWGREMIGPFNSQRVTSSPPYLARYVSSKSACVESAHGKRKREQKQ